MSPDDIGSRHSRGEKFVSLRVNLWAESEEHLRALYDELLAHDAVRPLFRPILPQAGGLVPQQQISVGKVL